jgi:hypothetical protein
MAISSNMRTNGELLRSDINKVGLNHWKISFFEEQKVLGVTKIKPKKRRKFTFF